MKTPFLFDGECFVDDRGKLGSVSGFDPQEHGIRRFYFVGNHTPGFVRAWHAHKLESKWITCVSGSALVAIAECEDPLNPDPLEPIQRFVISSDRPKILYVPNGYANGWKSLTDDCVLLVMSDKTLAESMEDDFRISWDFWNPWEVQPR